MKSNGVRRKSVVVGMNGWRGLLLVLLLMGSGGAPRQGFAKHACGFIPAKALTAFSFEVRFQN